MGLKDVRVLHYKRSGRSVELMIEQVIDVVRCPACSGPTQVKERPVVHYVDLRVYGVPMSLAWKKHRMRCVDPGCPKRSWVLSDHRIAAKNCLLTTRAAKWATVQVGQGRTVSEVAAELACDWHTVNDAAVYTVILPKAAQVVDPFHVISLANRSLDAVRRRVQTEQTGHRGRRDDPLYRARRVLLMGEEKLDAAATERLASLLALGDPGAEVAIAYRVKERLRDFYRTADPDEARQILKELEDHCRLRTMPPEIPKARPHHRGLVRQDRQLPPGPGLQRADRSAQQPDQAHQTDRLRVPQLRELPDTRPALRRQAELACARFDRRPVRLQTPPESEEPQNDS